MFNQYLNAHFQQGECRLIANAYDDCRNREVRLYALPGHWDVVGVTDGTDAWIAPAIAAPFFRTATGNVAEIMRRLQHGEEPLPVPAAPRRRAYIDEALLDNSTTRSRPRARL